LNNLVAIVDNNGIQGSGFVSDILPIHEPLIAAAKAAGWEVLEIDGHSQDLIKIDFKSQFKPLLVIANTVKGKGVSFMENSPKWHSNWLSGPLELQAFEELK
jgi:transketolase